MEGYIVHARSVAGIGHAGAVYAWQRLHAGLRIALYKEACYRFTIAHGQAVGTDVACGAERVAVEHCGSDGDRRVFGGAGDTWGMQEHAGRKGEVETRYRACGDLRGCRPWSKLES